MLVHLYTPKCSMIAIDAARDLWSEEIGAAMMAHSRRWKDYSAELTRAMRAGFVSDPGQTGYDGLYYAWIANGGSFSGNSRLKWLGLHFGEGAIQKAQAALLGASEAENLVTRQVSPGSRPATHPSCVKWKVTSARTTTAAAEADGCRITLPLLLLRFGARSATRTTTANSERRATPTRRFFRVTSRTSAPESTPVMAKSK
jgi:hypothetical protein